MQLDAREIREVVMPLAAQRKKARFAWLAPSEVSSRCPSVNLRLGHSCPNGDTTTDAKCETKDPSCTHRIRLLFGCSRISIGQPTSHNNKQLAKSGKHLERGQGMYQGREG